VRLTAEERGRETVREKERCGEREATSSSILERINLISFLSSAVLVAFQCCCLS